MNDALVLIFSRNQFYKRLHYLALGAFVLSIIIIISLATMLYFLINNPTKPLFFVTDKVSRLIPIIPVNVPNMSQQETVDWMIEGVEAAYTYNYLNYRAQIQSSQRYFTSYGWSTYLSTQQAGNILAVQERKMIVTGRVVGQPKLIAEGLLGGAYAWKFEMPLYVTYLLPPYDGKSSFSNALKVTVIVQRQPPLAGYKGLGFMQFVVEMP